MAKGPRFFCENCGVEVPRNADRCPRCGRCFASVRCPACGFIGAESLFTAGCPLCGYSAPAAGGPPVVPAPGRWQSSGALPFWVYLATAAALAGVALAGIYVLGV
jgi:hypothetical protein